jgi:hypothetical protein
MSSAGATILGAGYVIPIVYFIWSMRYGRHASANPGRRRLERGRPRRADGELREDPIVTHGPYEYARSTGGHGCQPAAGERGPAHHFESYEQQRETASLGMWTFLLTEIMFFGGLFIAYIVYRWSYPVEFMAGSRSLDIVLGTVNTGILIFSSFTMALAVRSAQLDRSRRTVLFLLATIVLGAAFLGIKAVEYHDKFVHHHLWPAGIPSGRRFEPGARADVLLPLTSDMTARAP